MIAQLPTAWQELLHSEKDQPYLTKLATFLEYERQNHDIYPPTDLVFHALQITPPAAVRAVIVGQDPYHGPGQAHGLAFSVPDGVKPPPSLNNIFKELATDLALPKPQTGCLIPWAKQGVLLLNTVLTVRANEAASHQGQGWESLTDAILRAVNSQPKHTIFVLWGAHAQKKLPLIDTTRHTALTSAHPSPLSARTGFFGSRPFSKINSALLAAGREPIDWTFS